TNQLHESWILRPDYSTEEFTLANDDVPSFTLPDPSNPFGAISPLQSQAAAVSTDESIQTAQYRSFTDGIVPALMLRVGKLPGMTPGDGERPVLTAEQRIEINETFKRLHRGV